MSRIVILTGSMRRGGNTDLLAKAFADGASLHNEVEILSVADYNVKPCTGCNSCFTSDGNHCVQKDDMEILCGKLKDADILVAASPIYFYGISAQLKAVVDRLHTPEKKGFKVKKLALLLVAGATIPNVFDSVKTQYQLILDYFKLDNAGMVLVNGVREKGSIEKTHALAEAYELGNSLT